MRRRHPSDLRWIFGLVPLIIVWVAIGEFIPQEFGPTYLACLFAIPFLLWRLAKMFRKQPPEK
jgi:hypothetical protein